MGNWSDNARSPIASERAWAESQPLRPESSAAPPSSVPTIPYCPLLLGTPPNAEMTFSSMVPFRVNTFALDVAKVVAEREGSRSLYNPLYCYAQVGLGKTHLLSAIANASCSRRVMMANAADVEAEYERAARMRCTAELRDWIVQHELVLLDDVQLCERSEFMQHELFAILNRMMTLGKAIVLSSDVPPNRLKGIEERLSSRLGCGPIVPLCMGDKQERRELLRSFAKPQGLPSEVLEYLAENVTDSIRRLKAVTAQLLALTETSGVAPSVELARALVPTPSDLARSSAPAASRVAPGSNPIEDKALSEKFKQMVASAETEQEQALALQITLGERLRQLTQQSGDPEVIGRFRKALGLLRDGNTAEALRCLRD